MRSVCILLLGAVGIGLREPEFSFCVPDELLVTVGSLDTRLKEFGVSGALDLDVEVEVGTLYGVGAVGSDCSRAVWRVELDVKVRRFCNGRTWSADDV